MLYFVATKFRNVRAFAWRNGFHHDKSLVVFRSGDFMLCLCSHLLPSHQLFQNNPISLIVGLRR